MTTNPKNRTIPRLLARCATLLLASIVYSPSYSATQVETALINSALPHERIGKGRDSVKVHWVRLQGNFEGANGHAAMMDELKSHVRSCVQVMQRDGREVRPPQVWPDYVWSHQRDTYGAANRSISYGTSILYTVNPSDCSLVENRKTVATLTSIKGICEIDLASKEAHGFCDARAHADAPPRIRTGARAHALSDRAVPPPTANRAALEALEKAMKAVPGKTGEHKTILGIECDVWKSSLDPTGTTCLSLGGSFVASHAIIGLTGSGMELEMTSAVGLNLQAIKAKLDANVNAAVFAPYLSDGFRVTDIGARK
jgi:hypothetical protein